MNGAVFAPVVLAAFIATADAGLLFEKKRLEFAPSASEKQVEARFAFVNNGKEPVTIRKVSTSCGCTTAVPGKEKYLPGESGEIVAVFKFGGRKGVQIKQVVVETSDPAAPRVNLELKATISDRLRVRPVLLFWKKGEAPAAKTISLEPRDGLAIESLSVTPSDPRVAVESKPDAKGYLLSVTPKRDGIPFRATVKIEINKGKDDAITTQAHVKVE